MFEELHIETVEKDGEVFIHAADLAQHLAVAATSFVLEAKASGVSDPNEILYCAGVHAGIMEAVRLLSLGVLEEDFEKSVETLDDLMKFR